MRQQIALKLLPAEATDDNIIKSYIASSVGKKPEEITGFYPLKKSIDARGKQIFFNLAFEVFFDEPFIERRSSKVNFIDVSKSHRRVIIVGAGPTGLFAALTLIENGIQPIILERGKDVRARRRDLAALNKEGVVNSDSNYCFGEGGAGTYSDGKLYTRSSKRGDINRILNLFVQFGAEQQILVEAHPHIGTNKLPQIITSIRQMITECGGLFLFGKKVVDFDLEGDNIKNVVTADGDKYEGEAVVLATGHSARDIFIMLHQKKILIEAKPLALGVRIEHPQSIIDSIQYHCSNRGDFLPPASYSLVQQVQEKGVFSFCMCPGGIIAPASTDAGELVVNGWSPSKRNNPFANSGMVVSVELKDLTDLKDFRIYLKDKDVNPGSPLEMMYFQKIVEDKAYIEGGGRFVAPAQRMADFCNNKTSGSLPVCSYLPGINSADLKNVLPEFIHRRLQEGFKAFGRKMKGYFTNEAVLVATESRTSSPVRIPRDNSTLRHPQIKNLYPCGEGAGYAGGIVSAAMDGERVAAMIAANA
jgi:uncharacterized FAD-dependent dehydrogenase